MIRRIEESISNITSKGNGGFIRDGKTPEIAKSKDGKEKSLENVKNMNSMSFEFATEHKDIFERNKFAESKKDRNVLDILIFLI